MYDAPGTATVMTEAELNEALEAALNDDEFTTIKLGSDITLKEPVLIGTQNTTGANGWTRTTPWSITLDGNNHKLIANYTEKNARAINVWCGANMTVTLKNLDVVGPASGSQCRGISTSETTNLKLNIANCNISTLYYALNVVDNKNPVIEVKNSTLTGYCAFQTFVSNTTATFTNCHLSSNNDWAKNDYNNFATIVINENASNAKLTFSGWKIEANQSTGNIQNILSVRSGSTGATVTFKGCKFATNNTALTEDTVKEYITNNASATLKFE